MATKEAKYPKRDPQLMYELAKDRLACQLGTIDAIDGKIATLVTLASAMLGIAAAVLALRVAPASTSQHTPSNTPALITLGIGVVVYLYVAYHGLRAYLARDWNIGPSLDCVWRQHKGKELDDDIKWGVANDFLYDYEENQTDCEVKTSAMRRVFVGAVLETAVLVIALSLVAAGV
jgi:hypothetical protein